MLGHEITNVKRENSKSILTGRELEYLSLASIGCENKMIGTILTVSKATVKKTFETVFVKLHARNRAHAVTIAFVHNILSEEIIRNITDKYSEKLQKYFLSLIHISEPTRH